jgi:hypothetical protein
MSAIEYPHKFHFISGICCKLIRLMERTPHWEVNILPPRQREFPVFYGTQRIIKWVHYWSLPEPNISNVHPYFYMIHFNIVFSFTAVWVVQSVYRRATGWIARFPEKQNFSPLNSVQICSAAHTASYPMGTGGYFPGGKGVGALSYISTSSFVFMAQCLTN